LQEKNQEDLTIDELPKEKEKVTHHLQFLIDIQDKKRRTNKELRIAKKVTIYRGHNTLKISK
jgi:hypothetical protein